jgi:hypothetical protein
MPKDNNQHIHIVTSCFIIALSRALKVILSLDVSIDEMKEISMKIFQKLVGPLADVLKNELELANNKWETFKEGTINGTKSTYNSFNPEFVKNNDRELEFHFHKCVFYEVFKANGELDLAPILCFYDNIFTKAVEEWIDFKRPKTIANGEEYCQFCYRFKKS